MKLKLLLLAGGLLALSSLPGQAQTTVITQPQATTTANASGTIAVTNTFQQVFAASTGSRGRTGCTIQNNGTDAMYVFFGPIASATTANSVKLITGQSVNCATSAGGVLKDQVSITGTGTEAFYAAQQ